MKRIGLVLASSPGYSETFFRNKIAVLHNAGFEVFLFTDRYVAPVANCRQVNSFTVPGSPVMRFAKVLLITTAYLLFMPGKVIRFLTAEKKDGRSIFESLRNLYCSLHILRYRLDWLHFGFAALVVGRENVARVIGAKMGMSFRGYDISLYPIKHPRCYALAWKRVDKVHTISDDLYQRALSLGLSPKVSMAKITPAIDTMKFTRSQSRRISNPVQILTTARLSWKKGLDIALGAMFILKQKGVSFQYRIVGDGTDYERLVYLRHAWGLDQEVHFLLKKTPDQLIALLNETDLYLQPSTQEGFCNATLEAQAIGLLCIVSNAGGLTENVLNGKTGWVVPKLDPHALAQKIQKVIAMPDEEKEQIRVAAVNRVQAEFTLERQKNEFRLFYTQV